MRNRIRLTEGQFNRIVKESVYNILNEISDDLVRRAANAASVAKHNKEHIDDHEYMMRKGRQHRKFTDEYNKRAIKKAMDSDVPVSIQGGDLSGDYKMRDLFSDWDTASYIDGHVPFYGHDVDDDDFIVGFPKLSGYHGPFKDRYRDIVRYMDKPSFDLASRY